MIFKSVYQFRDAVVYYAIKRGVQLYYQQNDPHRVRVKCSYEKCSWHLFASIEKKIGDFRVKTYKPVHICERQTLNYLCNAKFIAKYLKDYITANPSIRVWKMYDLLKNNLQVYKSKTVCRRAREIVVRGLMGNYAEEFRRLFDYRDCILETNPGSTCVVDCNIEGEGQSRKFVFKGMYVCFAAMKEGFKNGCRKCIGMDGCFLKGVHKGQILSATAKNGNNQIYPIAWAFVHNETTESWSWFCELLSKDLGLESGKGVTVVTDMQKGLDKAIDAILPGPEHRECARHILANWAKKWKGVERRQVFWRCAKCTFEAELKDNLVELRKLGGDVIVQDLLRCDIERRCRVYFKDFSACDTVDNNFSETFNSWIIGARHKSIISMMEEMRTQIMKRHVEMVEFAETWITDISPMAYKVLETNTSRAMKCFIEWNGDDGFEVVEGEYGHVVQLSKKIIEKIQPMPNLKMMPESSNPPVEPPPVKPLPGRPKRNRRKPRHELKKWGKAPRAGIQMTCSYCKGKNHNKKGCQKRKTDEYAQKNGESIGQASLQCSMSPATTTEAVSSSSKNKNSIPVASNKAASSLRKKRSAESASASQSVKKEICLLTSLILSQHLGMGFSLVKELGGHVSRMEDLSRTKLFQRSLLN